MEIDLSGQDLTEIKVVVELDREQDRVAEQTTFRVWAWEQGTALQTESVDLLQQSQDPNINRIINTIIGITNRLELNHRTADLRHHLHLRIILRQIQIRVVEDVDKKA